MAKKNELKELQDMVDALQAKNAELELENGDLREQVEIYQKEAIRADDRYSDEHKKWKEAIHGKIAAENARFIMSTRLEAAKAMQAAERKKRHASIPKFVIASAVALVLFIAAMELQKLNIIWPTLGFGVQCLMAMVIAWCYAIIWDRSRK